MYRPIGSYYEVSNSDYQPPWSGTPGWQLAPVPGWGTNPARSGPPVLATGSTRRIPSRSIVSSWYPVRDGLGDSESYANQGYITLAAASGIFLGWFFGVAYMKSKKRKKA